MERALLIKIGLGAVALTAAVLGSSEGSSFTKETDVPGSTQRFRGVVTEGKVRGGEKAKTVARAKITLEQAIQAAKEKVPGTVLGAELTEKDMAVWDVNILSTKGQEIHLSVDATTGSVFESEP